MPRPDHFCGFELAVRYQCANDQPLSRIEIEGFQLRNPFDIDQRLGLIEPLLHKNREMCAAGKDLGIACMPFEQRASLGDCRGFQVVEVLHNCFAQFKSAS